MQMQYHVVHKETFGEVDGGTIAGGRRHNHIRGGGGCHHDEKGVYNGRATTYGAGQHYRYEAYENTICEEEEEEHVGRYEKACGEEGGYSTSSHHYEVYEEEVVAVAGGGRAPRKCF
ncbi:hypothetical protein E2562_007532 [Oryza meyeriana var. granulata]|uniref:Uncharacterized protein n=1 Tax=Oryza meyeriana var. granulata TaxID=110450 RepID=A0A6G1DWF5_9ORYZ|nr:hypothetical protein E2562_007532 [Oryza meyeriana var. granulata]